MASHRVVDKNIIDELIVLEKANNKKDKNMQLMLMSDSDEIKKLHYFIFSSAIDVDYYTIDELEPEDISIIYDMDIIIFNKKDENLKESILQIIEAQKLDLKFFEISDSEYLRQKDHLIAHNSGIHKLFNRDFMLEEFVINIEIYLKSNFYTKRLLDLKEHDEIMIDSEKLFKNRIHTLLEKKIFFSLLKYSFEADTDIKSYNLRKIVRENDTIYYDEKNSMLHFLILNTIPSFGKSMINERMKNFSITLESTKAISAFELVFEDER
jgi:hypothetical protein